MKVCRIDGQKGRTHTHGQELNGNNEPLVEEGHTWQGSAPLQKAISAPGESACLLFRSELITHI